MTKPLNKFYNSSAWRRLASHIRKKYKYICQICGKAGYEVHHIKPIDNHNCSDANISLNEDNLTLLCHDCHLAQRSTGGIRSDLKFDDKGDVVERINPPR